MSGLGGHQQKSWVLICVMRKVEIRKEHAKQTKKKKNKTAETLYEKEEKGMMKPVWSDTTVLRTRLGRH